MKVHILITLFALTLLSCSQQQDSNVVGTDAFPDGTEISDWFKDSTKIDLSSLGAVYNIEDFGAVSGDSSVVNTVAIQTAIDSASSQGGGVVLVPEGIFMSGAIFFKPNTHLYVVKDGMLKGSNQIIDYPIQPSRMEGQNLDYFPALVNAYNVDGFTISGEGIIDGNGLEYWKAFWQRRKENPKCTNLEVSRPRLVFIWNSDNVQIQEVTLQNSGFWTTHFYQCDYVKVLNATILAPRKPVKAPSTDAIDLDVCSNVLIKGCYMSVNDDAVAMKGGKGPWADEDPNNGPNKNILIEDNRYGFCHSVITCGSENIHTSNVLMRNCTVEGAQRLIFLKMRPDTPQVYENITLENISGSVLTGIYIRPWTQFFDLKGRETAPVSVSRNVTFRNLDLECKKFAEVGITEHDRLEGFVLENIKFTSGKAGLDTALFDGIQISNVTINAEPWHGGDLITDEVSDEELKVFE